MNLFDKDPLLYMNQSKTVTVALICGEANLKELFLWPG